MTGTHTELEIEGTKIEVSNIDKVFYPRSKFTKGEILDYYIRISPLLLPHLRNRPVTLKRYPNGVKGIFFYEKNCPAHPKWVKTASVGRSEGGSIDYCLLNNLASLVWAVNLADLELHTSLHRASGVSGLNRPTSVAFDLDPGAPADIVTCCTVALQLKALFDTLHLESFPKTSGSKGMQVYVPLNTAVSYERTKAFAHAVAEHLERDHPDLVVSKMQKSLRTGKVLVDWSQNDGHKTTVNVYSLRAMETPMVSTPLTWDEVRKVATSRKAASIQFEAGDVLKRVKSKGDLFAPVLEMKQSLPDLASSRIGRGILKSFAAK